jgi:hypothetical protein
MMALLLLAAGCGGGGAVAGPDADGTVLADGEATLPDAQDAEATSPDAAKEAEIVPDVAPEAEPTTEAEVGPEWEAGEDVPGEAEIADAAEAGEVLQPCTQAEGACADGLGCVEGFCQPCTSFLDCRTTLLEGCSPEGVCGPCLDSAFCALEGAVENLACVAGECTECRVAGDCPEGLGCVQTEQGARCAACLAGPDCSGRVCDQGVCTDCTAAAGIACDDQGQYPDQAVVFCDPGTGHCHFSCVITAECAKVNAVCDQGKCRPCDEAAPADCHEYGEQVLCVAGACAANNCLIHTDCESPALPICDPALRHCRGCVDHAECTDRAHILDPAASAVCTDQSTCAPGDCYPADEACGQDDAQVCHQKDGQAGKEYWCEACAGDPECKASLGLDHAICDGQQCQAGCQTKATCEAGQICRDNHCLPCASNADCAGEYGDWLCVDQLCQDKQCNDEKPCADGRICDSNTCVECTPADHSACDLQSLLCVGNACVACSSQSSPDAACVAGYGAGYLCEGSLCLQGDCHGQADCTGANAGKVCSNHFCTACLSIGTTTAEHDQGCAGTFGFAFICDTNGAGCVPGCVAPDHNGLAQVCGADHRFRDCAGVGTGDGECVSAYGDLNKICDPMVVGGETVLRCQNGKTPGTACSLNGKKVVGADHRCGDCGHDADCENAWGAQYICEDAEDTPDATDVGRACTLGCTPGSRCADGKLCRTDKRCTACTDVAEDSLCGPGYLCIGGTCVSGVCRDSNYCVNFQNGMVCQDNQCIPCGLNATCPSGRVCVDGQCVTGDCCVDANCLPLVACGPNQNCTNHTCRGCMVGSDCHPQFACLDKSNACNADQTCVPPEQLPVKDGFCFIPLDETCYSKGTADTTGCRICYPETAEGGSRSEWTPGTWDSKTGWQRDHCFIDDNCVDSTTNKGLQPNYAKLDSADCWECNPQKGNRASLLDWSPVADPLDSHANWLERHECDDPFFAVPDPAHPGQILQSHSPAHAGTSVGYCWNGDCRGIAWTPWLPLGMCGAGTDVPPAVQVDGHNLTLFGVFGGGFGSGIPHANPGCFGPSCP